MAKHISCSKCGQHQEPTILWLTCEYCGIVLEEHPYFRSDDGDSVHEAEKEVGGQRVLRSW